MTQNQESRPTCMAGFTYKLQVPDETGAMMNIYITINNLNNKPFELFLNGFSSLYYEWLSLSMVLISRLLRYGVPASELIQDLRSIHSAKGSHLVPGKGFSPSLASRIGDILEEHVEKTCQCDESQNDDKD